MKIFKNGFSLVEILIGVSIAAVAGVILVSLMTSNSNLVSDQNIKINQGLELNNAEPVVVETIKSGASIVSQYPLTGAPTYTTGDETIVLSVPSVNAQGVVIANTYDYFVLTKDAQNSKILRKKVIVDSLSSRKAEDQVLLTKLSTLEFRYLDSSNNPISPSQAVRIGYIINVNDVVATENRVSSASGQVNLRNN